MYYLPVSTILSFSNRLQYTQNVFLLFPTVETRKDGAVNAAKEDTGASHPTDASYAIVTVRAQKVTYATQKPASAIAKLDTPDTIAMNAR